MWLKTMRHCFRAALLSVAAALPAAADDLILLDSCPADVGSCVMMDVRLVWPVSRELPIEAHPYYDSTDQTNSGEVYPVTQWFALPARLEGEGWHIHRVGIVASSGEMQCDDGLHDVAVVGFEPDGDPVVLSNRGTVVLSRSTIVVGCEDCLAILSLDGTVVAWHTTPSVEGDVDTGVAILPQSDGPLFVARPGACVKLAPGGRFQSIDPVSCDAKPLVPFDEAVDPVLFEELFDRWAVLAEGEIQASLYRTDRPDRILFWLRQACT
jgi:hypothetical protein